MRTGPWRGRRMCEGRHRRLSGRARAHQDRRRGARGAGRAGRAGRASGRRGRLRGVGAAGGTRAQGPPRELNSRCLSEATLGGAHATHRPSGPVYRWRDAE